MKQTNKQTNNDMYEHEANAGLGTGSPVTSLYSYNTAYCQGIILLRIFFSYALSRDGSVSFTNHILSQVFSPCALNGRVQLKSNNPSGLNDREKASMHTYSKRKKRGCN